MWMDNVTKFGCRCFKTLQKIMKQDLILEIMNYTHHYLKEKRQK